MSSALDGNKVLRFFSKSKISFSSKNILVPSPKLVGTFYSGSTLKNSCWSSSWYSCKSTENARRELGLLPRFPPIPETRGFCDIFNPRNPGFFSKKPRGFFRFFSNIKCWTLTAFKRFYFVSYKSHAKRQVNLE